MITRLLVDGHVHFHRCFTWAAFLDAASANFAAARAERELSQRSPGCLMLTETAGVDSYRALLQRPGLVTSVGWDLEKADDDCSIILSRHGRETIAIVGGRQLVTAERLEVLALGCPRDFPTPRPIRDVLHQVVDCGALAVIPWGLGKWWGRRGRILRQLLEGADVPPFCLGENGGRARLMRRPFLFDRAERRGLIVLGGSDPLPLRAQIDRPGSYGFTLDDWSDTSQPARWIKQRVGALKHSPEPFGELSSLPAMIRSQLGIRWRRQQVSHAVD